MSKLIGFTGLAGSGKSTAAGLLSRHDGMRVVSFAAPLKKMALVLLMDGFCYDLKSADSYLVNKEEVIPELGVTMRYLLQTLGTDWGIDRIAYDLWVRSAVCRVELAFEEGVEVGARDVVIENSCTKLELYMAIDAAVQRFYAPEDELLRLCLTPCAYYVA